MNNKNRKGATNILINTIGYGLSHAFTYAHSYATPVAPCRKALGPESIHLERGRREL